MATTWTNDRAELDGFQLTRRTVGDSDNPAPWENEDGHGPVSGWRRWRDADEPKGPGELQLIKDGWSARYYDFAEACRIARRDGWGWLPEPLRIIRDKPSQGDGTACGGEAISGRFRAYDADNFNAAVAKVYAQHRKSMSAKAYAAEAARRDFERLRAWCNGEWSYVGVIVEASRAGVELGHASLWGIESDSDEYLDEVADELVEEALEDARAKLAELCQHGEDAA